MSSRSPLRELLDEQRERHATAFTLAAVCAGLLGWAAVCLLGLSGWFITAAAAAGAGGVLVAQGFNYLLPSAGIRLLAITRTAARYGERLASHEAALRSAAHLRPALFDALCNAPAPRALAVGGGEAAAAMLQDIASVEAQLVRRSTSWTAIVGALSALALLGLGGWAPLLATSAWALALAVATHAITRVAQRAALAQREALGTMKDELAWLSSCDAELRCHALEVWAAGRVAVRERDLHEAQRRWQRSIDGLDALIACVSGAAAASALALAHSSGAAIAALCALSAVTGIDTLAPWLRHTVLRGAAQEAARRLDGVLALPGESPPPQPQAQAAGHAVAASITFPALALEPLQPGERMALTGPSGCGKTTLIETLLGLRVAAPGVAQLGGRDIREIDADTLRRQFAWLPQDATLLAGTVRESLLLAAPADGSDDALWTALRRASLDQRVRSLPMGLDTWLGADGARLSGGERRRLALARACLLPAPWLLLDEPTEGLDVATETRVIDGLREHLAETGQGLILISHRAAPLALCERAIKLKA